MDRIFSTEELEIFINKKYEPIVNFLKENKICYKLDIYFAEGTPNNIEGTYVYSDLYNYHYVFTEKGKIMLHKITNNLFEISYLIYEDSIFQIAVDYELKHRNYHQNFRRIVFKTNLYLLSLLGKDYKKRGEDEINEILKDAPYDDNNT